MLLSLLADLGFRRHVLHGDADAMQDLGGTHGVFGGVIWAFGCWVPPCNKVGAIIVILGGFLYLGGHAKKHLYK